jgi:predicted transcriptional regulator/DNA-binding XRE family transcriptional regulator
MNETPRLGAKVRALRRQRRMSQVELAEKLSISASYLNLIEHGRRPLTAPLLIKLARNFDLDLESFAAEGDDRLVADLLEAFSDPLFESHGLTGHDVREMASASPTVASAVLSLYRAYAEARQSAETLAERVSLQDDLPGLAPSHVPSEEVTDVIQKHFNHFADLEEGAERLRRDAGLNDENLTAGLAKHLEDAHGVEVRVETVGEMNGAVRRFDAKRRVLRLSEALGPRSRCFQLAHQVGLLTQGEAIDRIAADPALTGEDARALCRVALANYYAGAVMMPYEPFLAAARAERYDVELLGHRFRASFEQVCHRLTTLQRPGAQGIPFHMLRVDIAGNLSKRFSASGIRFARFSGACPRWNVFAAFLTPGHIRVQVSRMPDGHTYFCVARTVTKGGGGFRTPRATLAVGLGCEVEHAREMVYADGLNLSDEMAIVPVGVTCRLCERMDCEQRAVPPLEHPLHVDENVRGVSFYAPLATHE